MYLLLLTFAPIAFDQVVFGGEERIGQAGVLQVVHALADQARHVGQGVDFGAGDAAQASVEALHAGGSLVVGEH